MIFHIDAVYVFLIGNMQSILSLCLNSFLGKEHSIICVSSFEIDVHCNLMDRSKTN